MDELIAFDAFIAEIGDLGMGLKGGKPGKGVELEAADGWPVQISGLTKAWCQALAPHLRGKVRVTITRLPDNSGSET